MNGVSGPAHQTDYSIGQSISYWSGLWDEATGGFRFAPHQPPTLMATAYAVLGLEFAGGLTQLGDEQESRIVSFIMAGSEPDGSFVDRLFDLRDVLSEDHDFAYFQEETTTFCQQALDALLSSPPLPRERPASWSTTGRLISCLESFPWRNPWLDSNRVMFMLSQLCHDAERHQQPELLAMVDSALDWLDAHQSPKTGLWHGPHDVSLENAMAATFHFTFYYGYRRRPFKHLERVIDSCLGLQQPDGLFSGCSAGHTCLDYDAVDLLAKASLATDYRRDDVCRAMHRAAGALMRLRNGDGGFAHCKEHPARLPNGLKAAFFKQPGLARLIPYVSATGEYSVCWRPLSCATAASNAFSTWFRLLALSLAEQGQWTKSEEPMPFNYRRLPFLGYHDPLAIQSAHGVIATAPLAIEREYRSKGNALANVRNPLISVIMPAHNAGRCLENALSSLRAQTYPRWEAIVVDDGSTDDTGDTARRWARADPRIRLIEQDNKGVGAARNAALSYAQGELIHCLDADDLIEPFFYDSILKVLPAEIDHDSPGTCAFSGVRYFRGSCRIISSRRALPSASFTFSALSQVNPGPPVCYVFERRILLKTGTFDESLQHCHDWDLWLRFSRIGVNFVPVDAACSMYRVASGTLSTAYVSYVDTAARVLKRTTEDDSRCSEVPGLAAPVDRKHIQTAIIRFWYFNVLRALNAGAGNAAADLFIWARKNFPREFWGGPHLFGFMPEFGWADIPPPPAQSIETRWRSTLLLLELFSRFWPELSIHAIHRITGSLARAIVIHMSRRNECISIGKYKAIIEQVLLSTDLGSWRWQDLMMVLTALLVPRFFLECTLKIWANIRERSKLS
jgi:glycosyltransferase involved in cell wall biosynthesis/prenyltransferase beta subunit